MTLGLTLGRFALVLLAAAAAALAAAPGSAQTVDPDLAKILGMDARRRATMR